MPNRLDITTRFRDNTVDVGQKGYVPVNYILENYPYLAPPGLTAGYVYGWGSGTPSFFGGSGTPGGLIGDNTTTSRSSPVQEITYSDWRMISNGYSHCVGIKKDGSLWSWGSNGYGQMGDNTNVSRSSPVQTVAGGNNWTSAVAGMAHTLAIKSDGTLWAWGANYGGECGVNSRSSFRKGISSPVQTIALGNNWKQVAAGMRLSGAVKNDGTLWMWGDGRGSGSVGANAAAIVTSPVQTVALGTNWKKVWTSTGSSTGTGFNSVTALKYDGTLWTWGNNSGGQLGDNTTTNRSSPVQEVTQSTNWIDIGGCADTSAGIKSDYSLWLWGSNSRGNLGDNSATNRSSPVQTISAGNTWRLVTVSSAVTLAIKVDGSLWSWGWNVRGQIGNGIAAATSYSSPIQIGSNAAWRMVSAGYYSVHVLYGPSI